MEWQPIETAPKFLDKRSYKAIWVGRFTEYPHHDKPVWGMEPVQPLAHGQWRNIYSEKLINWEPQFWMPLPPPPVEKIDDAVDNEDDDDLHDPTFMSRKLGLI